MSAFVVSKTHIDLMVTTALYGPRPMMPAQSWDLRWFDQSPERIRAEAAKARDYEAHARIYQQHIRRVDEHRAAEVGWMLLVENLRSVRYRYPDTEKNPDATPGPIAQYWAGPYTWADPGYRMTAGEALAAIACYEYQSCEHPGWQGSEAYQFCDALIRALAKLMPGYSDAPWEWDKEQVEQAKTRALTTRGYTR